MTASTLERTTDPARPPRSGGRRTLRAPRFVLAIPAGVYLGFFFVAPVALVLWFSLGYKPGIFGTHSNSKLSLDRYKESFDSAYLPTYENTLRIAFTGTALCLLISLPFAYWLAVKVSPKWRGLLLSMVLIPYWTSFLIRTIGWSIILSPNGWLSTWLQDIGLRHSPISVLYTRSAVQLGVVYNYLPLMILPLYVAFERIDPALCEASRDLGANRWRTLAQVTLPIARPGIAAGLVLVFIPLMGDYVTATILGGAKGNMVGQLVASQFETGQNWALGSAMAVTLIIFIGLTVAILYLLARTLGFIGRTRRGLAFAPEATR